MSVAMRALIEEKFMISCVVRKKVGPTERTYIPKSLLMSVARRALKEENV